MTNAVSITDLEALIAAAKADLDALLDKVNTKAHSKSDLHRVHFKQTEVALMEAKLAERLNPTPAPVEAPRAPISETEYAVLSAFAALTELTTIKAVAADVNADRRARGERFVAADIVADQLVLRGHLTGSRKATRPDAAITDRGRAILAAAAPFYA